MPLRATRFGTLILAAVTLGFGLSHLLQLPARMGWDQYLWVGSTVQGGLYAMSASLGAIIQVATMIALVLLVHLVREHQRPGFKLAVASAALFLLAIVAWWVLVYPVDVELAKWANGPVPADWTTYRSRWEWGHAAISVLELIGFGALVGSVLADTPGDTKN